MGILTLLRPSAMASRLGRVKEAGRRVVELSKHRGVRLSDLALQFAFAHPYVATTLAGMPTVEQVRQNVDAASGAVDETLLAEVLALVAPYKNRSWPSGLPENHDA